jgi:hypothetical protein
VLNPVGKQTHDLTVIASDSKTTQSGGDNRKSDIASHCKKIYIYFIEITFLSQFCLFNTLFHVYPTTARKKNFAGLVKRHLAGIFLRLSPPDCVVLESLAITVKSWAIFAIDHNVPMSIS